MKLVLFFVILTLTSCGKDNVRKSSPYPDYLINQDNQSIEEKDWMIEPEFETFNEAKVSFLGEKIKTFTFKKIKFDKDIHFHKKWTYLAKLQNDQDSRYFNFPIDQIDRRLNLVRLHSINQANQFNAFSPSEFLEVELKLNLKMRYLAMRALNLKNVQIKLIVVDNEFKRYEMAEAPLLKYDSEYEELQLEKGVFVPNYDYDLTFKIKPDVMHQVLSGKLWMGLYVSNIDLETSKTATDYQTIWNKEYDKARTWIMDKKLNVFEGERDVQKLMSELDNFLELRNDGQVMYFLERRSNESGQWKVLKNGKFTYVTYISNEDLDSFEVELKEIQDWRNYEGTMLIEVEGHVQSTSLSTVSKVLTSTVDEPRTCTRWTRYDKRECIRKDLSCHVTLNKEVVNFSRPLKKEDLSDEFVQRDNVFYTLIDQASEIVLPETVMSSAVIGVVGVGHCPSRNEAGFSLPGYTPMSWAGEVGIRYDLKVVVKKPASFQLWF